MVTVNWRMVRSELNTAKAGIKQIYHRYRAPVGNHLEKFALVWLGITVYRWISGC